MDTLTAAIKHLLTCFDQQNLLEVVSQSFRVSKECRSHAASSGPHGTLFCLKKKKKGMVLNREKQIAF